MEVPTAARLRRYLDVTGGIHAVGRALRDAVRDAAYPVLISDDDDPLATVLDRGRTARRRRVRRSRRLGSTLDPHHGALVGL